MKNLTENFFQAYFKAFSNNAIYTDGIPQEMMLSPVDEDGYFKWTLLTGTLKQEDYVKIEQKFGVKFPKSFIEWHKAYHFLDGDCSYIRLPHSSPVKPMERIIDFLDWSVAARLIEQKLYPFGDEGNDAGPLVFDARQAMPGNEFPIRMYDHEYQGDLDGLSEVIFSSFPKLLECITHFMTEVGEREREDIIPDFFQIDPEGAGTTGRDYWLGWI